ncbi:sugar phosphate isomerase/epimerase family protein [Haloplanus aerogenes]|uniref:Sugar phosphate isomerase/epimerase n=1 Tax=Haloplanus aerogenes TaxID=660522 RepID=A0A3M0DQE4_9EURY|nr:TIM barrel protein [Haloplanus aerogenes]AZH24561.1 sugar phosphate isomerase/epimerase [Haloplanus aerogenes]RMB23784.1 sugar phosphate isomerase/epimerase [Haloplanus aerogenes]
MTSPDIRFSVPDLFVSRAGRDGESSRRRAFLEAVGRECDAVELFVTPPRHESDGLFGFLNAEYQLRGPVQRLREEYGLDVASVHGTPMYDLCSNGGWQRCLSAVKDAQSSLTDDGGREPYADPSVLTAHPPRFPTGDDPDLQPLRSMLVANLAEAAARIEDSEWLSTTVAVENVCPRGRFEYLLTTPGDAQRLRRAHQAIEMQPDTDREAVPDSLQFTCDLGHAREPLRMLDAMRPLASIHIHGTVPDDDRRLSAVREEYGLAADESVGTLEPGGRYHHLPPRAGDLSIGRVFDCLDDRNYGGSIVVELDPPYRTPAVVGETVDYLRERR